MLYVIKSILMLSLLIFTVSLHSYDFNKDGNPDFVFKNDLGYLKTWEMDNSFSKLDEHWLTNLGSDNWEIYEDIIDLDNDGDVDIIIQDKTTGYIKAIEMNGFSKSEIKWIANPGGSDWNIVGLKDIDGNSYPDIILQQSSTGYVKAIKLGADFSNTPQWIGSPGGSIWEVYKVSDVDNDGIADIIFQNTELGYIKAYKLDSTFTPTAKWIGNPGSQDWAIHGVADIDGDSITDIVLQNITSGYVKAYQLDSTFKGTAKWIGNPAGSEWEVKNIIDIDGDGIRDVIMQHRTLGYIKAYQLDSTFLSTAKWVGNPGGPEWKIEAIKDMDNDGIADIIFQNETLGYVKAFDIDSTFKGTDTWMGNPGSGWNINVNSDEEAVVDTQSVGKAILFSAQSGSIDTDSLQVGSSYVSWDKSSKSVLKYDLSTETVDVADTTVSYSYSSTYIYPMTKNGKLYTIKTRSSKDITGFDASTLVENGETASQYTDDTYKGFAIVDDKVFYIDTSDDLRVRSFSNPYSSSLLIESQNIMSASNIYGIGSNLVSANYSDGIEIINLHNTSTGEISQELYRASDVYSYKFYDGDEALYWAEFDDTTKNLKVLQYKLSGSPTYIFETTLVDTPANLVIDDSNGKIFIAYKDGYTSVATKYFYMIDGTSYESTTLDIDSSLFSSGIYGMQFVWVE